MCDASGGGPARSQSPVPALSQRAGGAGMGARLQDVRVCHTERPRRRTPAARCNWASPSGTAFSWRGGPGVQAPPGPPA
jgi:hypothetical protein